MASERAGAARRVFKEFDTNHDGYLSKAELHAGLWKLGQTDDPETVIAYGKYINRLFKKADYIKDGQLDFDEFLSIVSAIRHSPRHATCA